MDLRKLDIHHISTGRGNAAMFVLPDGTMLLVDASGRILGERQVQIDSPRPNLSDFQPLLHY